MPDDLNAALGAMGTAVATKKATARNKAGQSPLASHGKGGPVTSQRETSVAPATHQSCKTRTFENVNDASNTAKFYEVTLVEFGLDQWVLKHWGRIGSAGQWQVSHTEGGGQREYDAECAKRKTRGYTGINDVSYARVPNHIAARINDPRLGGAQSLEATLVLSSCTSLQQDIFATGSINGPRLAAVREQVEALRVAAQEAVESLALTELLAVKFG
jgi:predicted DNA-binding WGR domain protein